MLARIDVPGTLLVFPLARWASRHRARSPAASRQMQADGLIPRFDAALATMRPLWRRIPSTYEPMGLAGLTAYDPTTGKA